MRFEIEVAGRTRSVSIERAGGPTVYRVTIDDDTFVVDVRRTGEHGLSLLQGTLAGEKGTPIGESADVHVTPGAAPGELLVALDGRTATVTVNGRRTGHAGEAGVHGHGEISIVAPMPGRVVRVLAAAGDDVAARQGVVVVEAMKMENELRAPRAGRVREITVTPGTSVEAGRVLAVIE